MFSPPCRIRLTGADKGLSVNKMLLNTQNSYGVVAKLLHWLVAIVVLGLFGVGFWMVDLGYYDYWNKLAPHYHKSIGILLLVVMVFRVAWRFFNVTPVTPRVLTPKEQKASHYMHIVLYIMIFGMCVTGFLISTADGRAIYVFNWFSVPSLGAFVDNQEDIAGSVHEWLSYGLIGLAIIHMLAALKHHFINRDDVLTRML